MAKKKWSELPAPGRAAILAVGSVQVALLIAAQVDITRTPAERIRGSKLRWRLISLINIVGPLLYFTRGRR
jgi:hypothetical protein